MNRNIKRVIDPRYTEQQLAIMEVANELGLFVYKPDYHANKTDKNTVLIYTKAAHEYNKKLPEWADNNDYAPYICSLENSDRNGSFDLDFMNYGEIDFRNSYVYIEIKAHIQRCLNAFVAKYGNKS